MKLQQLKSLSLRNKLFGLFLTLFGFILIYSSIYLLFGNAIIEKLYSGEAFLFIKPFPGRLENSLEFYIKRYHTIFLTLLAFNLLIVFCLIGATSLVRYIYNIKNNFSPSNFFHEFIAGIRKNFLPENKKLILITLGIPIAFFLIYFFLGKQLVHQYDKYELFGTDISEQIEGWTSLKLNSNQKGSHPLLPLFTDLLATGLNQLVPSKFTSVIIVNAFFASIGVFGSFMFFRLLLEKFFAAVLLTLIFSLSMSQLVFGAIPETYALAGVSIIFTHVLFLICLRDQKLYPGYWILAGIFSFGITITNFAQSIICFSIAVFILRRKYRFARILEYLGVVVLSAFFLSLIQYKIFPGAALFFRPLTVTKELRFVTVTLLNQPPIVIYELIKHFFIVNFVSPSNFLVSLSTFPIPPGNNISVIGFFRLPLHYLPVGLAGIVLWLAIFISGLFTNLKNIHHNRPIIYAIILCILSNLALHSMFGAHEMFLYTCHFTILVLALATNRAIIKNKYYMSGLIGLIILMGINNLWVMKQIIDL